MDIIPGSTYRIQWQISRNKCNPEPIDNNTVEKIEFYIHNIIKTYPDNVIYSPDEQAYIVNLTQQDTLSLPAGRILRHSRVKYKDNTVKSTKSTDIYVFENEAEGEI